MNKTYYDLLIKQYLSANGLTAFNYSKEEKIEFVEWVKQQQKTKEIYQIYLLSAGLCYNDNGSAEIGKGVHDTIVSSLDRSILVTPLSKTFKSEPFSKKIVPGTLYVRNEMPCALIEDRDKGTCRHLFLPGIDLFYTQNIYSPVELNSLVKVHNKGKSIVVGAYGKLYDKDRVEKIEQLRSIKSQLMDRKYKEVYVYSKDNYIYFIHTDSSRYREKRGKNKDYTLIKER